MMFSKSVPFSNEQSTLERCYYLDEGSSLQNESSLPIAVLTLFAYKFYCCVYSRGQKIIYQNLRMQLNSLRS